MNVCVAEQFVNSATYICFLHACVSVFVYLKGGGVSRSAV